MNLLDLAASILLIMGASLALIAAIGVVRFPDVLTRMHAATKPQTLGLLFILAGLGLRSRDLKDLSLLVIIMVFQLMTAPVSAHMVGRAAFRTNQVDRDQLAVDESPRN